GKSSTRLGVQLNDARQSFEKITEKNAEAMMMLAEAMKLQAEALVQLGQAIDKLANKATCSNNIVTNEY
ncbi:hypothetical protein X777_02187, partial [Ooceraea biroi]